MADDLATWLTQIWDEMEPNIRMAIRTGEHGVSQFDLDRLAADRKILARLQALEAQRREQIRDYQQWVDGSNARRSQWEYDSQEMKEIEGLRYVVRLHASLYADRPGYREEWRPA